MGEFRSGRAQEWENSGVGESKNWKIQEWESPGVGESKNGKIQECDNPGMGESPQLWLWAKVPAPIHSHDVSLMLEMGTI